MTYLEDTNEVHALLLDMTRMIESGQHVHDAAVMREVRSLLDAAFGSLVVIEACHD